MIKQSSRAPYTYAFVDVLSHFVWAEKLCAGFYNTAQSLKTLIMHVIVKKKMHVVALLRAIEKKLASCIKTYVFYVFS